MKSKFDSILAQAQERVLSLFIEGDHSFAPSDGKFYLGATHCGTFNRLH